MTSEETNHSSALIAWQHNATDQLDRNAALLDEYLDSTLSNAKTKNNPETRFQFETAATGCKLITNPFV